MPGLLAIHALPLQYMLARLVDDISRNDGLDSGEMCGIVPGGVWANAVSRAAGKTTGLLFSRNSWAPGL